LRIYARLCPLPSGPRLLTDLDLAAV